MFLNSFRPKQPLVVKNNLQGCPCLQCALVNRLSIYVIIVYCDTDMTLEYCHCLQDPSCTASCSATTGLHYQGLSLLSVSAFPIVAPINESLKLFLSATSYQGLSLLPFFLLPPSMTLTTASWFSFQESVRVSLNPPAQLSQSGSVLSLFLCIYLHSSASLGQFCPCCSASTCTFCAS